MMVSDLLFVRVYAILMLNICHVSGNLITVGPDDDQRG